MKAIEKLDSMIPFHVLRVTGRGIGSVDGKIISKICLGDGKNVLLELCIPLICVNDRDSNLPKNRIFELDHLAEMHEELVDFLNMFPFYLAGVKIKDTVHEYWNMLRLMSSRVIHEPPWVDLGHLWIDVGGWNKPDWSLPTLNWLAAGALLCQNPIIIQWNSYEENYNDMPTVFRLYTRDNLLALRNLIVCFYICSIPFWFPSPSKTCKLSQMSIDELCEFIPCAIEELSNEEHSIGKFNTSLQQLRPLETHFCRDEFDIHKAEGALKEFHAKLRNKQIKWTKLVWKQEEDLPIMLTEDELDYEPSDHNSENCGQSLDLESISLNQYLPDLLVLTLKKNLKGK